jgi:hypothetical protein
LSEPASWSLAVSNVIFLLTTGAEDGFELAVTTVVSFLTPPEFTSDMCKLLLKFGASPYWAIDADSEFDSWAVSSFE